MVLHSENFTQEAWIRIGFWQEQNLHIFSLKSLFVIGELLQEFISRRSSNIVRLLDSSIYDNLVVIIYVYASK